MGAALVALSPAAPAHIGIDNAATVLEGNRIIDHLRKSGDQAIQSRRQHEARRKRITPSGDDTLQEKVVDHEKL